MKPIGSKSKLGLSVILSGHAGDMVTREQYQEAMIALEQLVDIFDITVSSEVAIDK